MGLVESSKASLEPPMFPLTASTIPSARPAGSTVAIPLVAPATLYYAL